MRWLTLLSLSLPALIAAQWGSVVNLSPNSLAANLNENMGPCLAVNGDTVHVVWSDRRSAGSAIYYRRSVDTGLTWSAAVAITDTLGKASFPVIAVNGQNVHVVWMDSLNGIRASYYQHSLDGGNTWEPKICLDTNTAFWPGVAVSDSTVLVSLNKRLTATNTEIFFMRSLDNGATWSAEQQLSNANGRSEDQAMAVQGNDVHLTWNENRNGPMEIYTIRSKDLGVTWGPETQITTTDSYSSMVSLFGSDVDIPYGNSFSGNLDVWIRQSSDSGTGFGPIHQLTNVAAGEAYPFLTRDGMNLYLVYIQFGTGTTSAWYIHSGDGGTTWSAPYSFGPGFQPFIAYTGTVLHVIWPNAGHIYYLRNPAGNPSGVTGGGARKAQKNIVVSENRARELIEIHTTSLPDAIELCDMSGRVMTKVKPISFSTRISTAGLARGMYLIRAKNGNVYSAQILALTRP